MKNNIKKRIRLEYWLPALFWMGVIFYFSNESSLSIGVGGPREYLLRKFAHISEFGILAVLFLILLAKGCNLRKNFVFLPAFLLAMLFAFSDEFHQTFVLGRNGNLADVLVDSLGALLFLQGIALISFEERKKIFLLSFFLNVLAIWLLLASMLEVVLLEEKSVQDKHKYQIQKELNTEGGAEIESDAAVCEETYADIDEYVEKKEIIIPKEVLLDVPFSSQAPFAIWDELHEEACEEMSLIMVKYFFDNKKLTPQIAEQEIQALKEYQIRENGHYIDSNMAELNFIAKDHFSIETGYVRRNVTKEDILKSLAQNSPVIVPTAGRLLNNPNFSGLGPLYHNLVIIGFKDGYFITNDPGTRNGKMYKYSFEVLMDAIHDFPGNKKQILSGEKAAILFVEID